MKTDRCTDCQVGQGRNCACRSKRRQLLSAAELIVLISVASVAASLGAGWVLVHLWRAMP